MQILLVLFGLVSAIIRPVADAMILAGFQQQALAQHNYFRQQLHCTAAMALNVSLNSIAQNYSEYLAANNLFVHSGAAGLGENLWMMSASATIAFVNGSTPTIGWYNEISLYNYSSPGFSSATGHFTQVVWSDSTQLGIGIAFTNNSLSAYVVANYYPAGNVLGQFATEVPALCTSTTTAGTTTNVGTTTSAGTTVNTSTATNLGTTINTQRSNNSAEGMIQQRPHLSAVVIVLSSLFRLCLN